MKKALLSLLLCTCISCSAAAQDLCKVEIEGVNATASKEEANAIWTKSDFIKQEDTFMRGMGNPLAVTYVPSADHKSFIQSVTHKEISVTRLETGNKPVSFNTLSANYTPDNGSKEDFIALQKKFLKQYCDTLPQYLIDKAKEEPNANDPKNLVAIREAEKSAHVCEPINKGEFRTHSSGYIYMPSLYKLSQRNHSEAGCFMTVNSYGNRGGFTVTYQGPIK